MSATVTETEAPAGPLKVHVEPQVKGKATSGGEELHAHGTAPPATAATTFQPSAQQLSSPPAVSQSAPQAAGPAVSAPQPPVTSISDRGAGPEALPRETQLAESTTSIDLKPSEAGHLRRFIKVPNGWYAKKGNKVMDGLYVGEPLGKGLQGGVYNLVDEHGTVDRTKVLKAKHRYALLVKVKREWEIGRCISNLYEPDKALPGYMATGEGVVNEKGNFIGMILERLEGVAPSHVVKQSDFNDIHYLEEFLFCLFNALDIGQKSVGFHHSDLRVSNVMEIKSKKKNPAGAEQMQEHDLAGRAAAISFNGENVGQAAAERLNQFRIIDYGLADFTEFYPAGRVDVGGPTHAVPKSGPVHVSIGKLEMSLPVPLTLEQVKALPKINPIERMYRYFWKNKGDVYHVCWDLTRYLDGRVWPREDEKQVKLLFALIHHVTGVRLKAWFAEPSAADKDGKLKIPKRRGAFAFVQHNDGFLHILRVRAIRLQAWFRPHNPGVTAAEALCAPFFEKCIHVDIEQQ